MFLKSVVVSAFTTFVVGQSSLPSCRILPSDSSWPAQDVWDTFNTSIDGRLIKTVPIGSPCHDPTFDQAQCDVIRNNWHSPEFHEANPSSIADPVFLNKSCDPFDPRETPCQIGAYVQYAVNVSSREDVIQTLQFVKEHNIRFVIKNTGHDYMGRSTGTGAVSVWMHNLQEIAWIPEFQSSNYTGPAFKVQAGVTGSKITEKASKQGLVVVSGACPTVGFTGGYIQGGGHSPLSTAYGLAADQTLEFEVITTQGDFVTASPTKNSNLFWALSGGGGGTYGIVWTVTVKAHKDLPITIGSVNFTLGDNTQDLYWKAIDAYQASTPDIMQGGAWAIAVYNNVSFSLFPVFGVNLTVQEVAAILRSLLHTLDSLGVHYTTATQTFPGYLDALNSVQFLANFQVANVLIGSRLLPRSLWKTNETIGNVQSTIRSIVDGGASVFDITMKATLRNAGDPVNAVLPAWRDAERHFIFTLPLVDGESIQQILQDRETITTQFLAALKRLTSVTGSYINEADSNDLDFKDAFYGANYDMLLHIKDKWDPDQIMYGRVAVGGDRWFETEEGRLCRTDATESP
ncbi:hypothetical protein E1B28_005626 [Marasmius oreades]|uniref:FAD-binding PCMH-type domain-containing protein n=1 Tax=Marasmius oreades TaxID=181124 RepID=A0A9P7S5G8_9AGAR|nr:uncharacterized protein E1B28_005626 [Marasmius oreades]KAG7094813.1 hypothetical protein E1B28_005626 [Marasmius oreades]